MIKIFCDRAEATLQETETLTAGRQGLICEFSFSKDWDGFGKKAYVRAGTKIVSVVLDNNRIFIPAECMEKSGVNLIVGVYGTDGLYTVIPTVWCSAGLIEPSTDEMQPSNITTEPTASEIDQMLALVQKAADEALSAATAAESIAGLQINDIETDNTDADKFGQATVAMTEDRSSGSRVVTFHFANLKGRSVAQLSADEDGNVTLQMEGEEPQIITAIPDAIRLLTEALDEIVYFGDGEPTSPYTRIIVKESEHEYEFAEEYEVAELRDDLAATDSRLSESITEIDKYKMDKPLSWIDDGITIVDGLYNIETHSVDMTGGTYRHVSVDVVQGEKYRIGGRQFNNRSYALGCYIDSNGQTVEIIDYGSNVVVSDYETYAPKNATSLIVNGNDYNTLSVKKAIFDDFDFNKQAIYNWFNDQKTISIIDEQKKNPFAWGYFDKGCIVFTFDDALNDIDLVEELSEEYGIPVCYSVYPENMNNITTATGEGKKVKEVLASAQFNGNEVLCHGRNALNESSTDDDIYNLFVLNKKKLEGYGFDINGIIEVGSGGEERSFDSRRAENYLRTLYRYSDHYGRGLNLPQYDTGRTYIQMNKDVNHSNVDRCAAVKSLLVFVTHGITESDSYTGSLNVSTAILRDLFEYVKTKDVYLLTFKGAYDMFRSSVLENRIKALEN